MMSAATDCDDDQLQTPSSASADNLKPPKIARASSASGAHTVSISAQTYARLLSLADQAPLECLALSARTLASAKILGYNQIGQIRSTPMQRLLDDLGEDRADELKRALYDFGMRQYGDHDD